MKRAAPRVGLLLGLNELPTCELTRVLRTRIIGPLRTCNEATTGAYEVHIRLTTGSQYIIPQYFLPKGSQLADNKTEFQTGYKTS